MTPKLAVTVRLISKVRRYDVFEFEPDFWLVVVEDEPIDSPESEVLFTAVYSTLPDAIAAIRWQGEENFDNEAVESADLFAATIRKGYLP